MGNAQWRTSFAAIANGFGTLIWLNCRYTAEEVKRKNNVTNMRKWWRNEDSIIAETNFHNCQIDASAIWQMTLQAVHLLGSNAACTSPSNVMQWSWTRATKICSSLQIWCGFGWPYREQPFYSNCWSIRSCHAWNIVCRVADPQHAETISSSAFVKTMRSPVEFCSKPYCGPLIPQSLSSHLDAGRLINFFINMAFLLLSTSHISCT